MELLSQILDITIVEPIPNVFLVKFSFIKHVAPMK
jgi:hypothetical protein